MERKSVYFLGIGGIGMSALARYFLHEGYRVAGYDRTRTALTDALTAEGAAIHYEDDVQSIPAEFLDPARTIVVYTPAVPQDHGEYTYFREHGFRIEKRSQMLGLLAEGKYVMAVAGTHGKTTTSTLVAWLNRVLTGGGSAFLGGLSKNFDGNLVLGDGKRLAVEADEFDRSFLRLYPDVAVVTSADADHLDIYGTHEAVKEAFAQFIRQIRPDGFLIIKQGLDLTIDNAEIKVCRYSYDTPCDFYARNIELIGGGHYRYDVVTPSGVIEGCTLGIPGWVNIENSVAAVASVWCAAQSRGEEPDADRIREALSTFSGVKRRFEFYVNTPKQVYMDDYAHHPRELAATLTSVRQMFPGRRITALFQPPYGVRRGTVACRRGGAAADLPGARGADRGGDVGSDRPSGDGSVPDRRPRPAGRNGCGDGYGRGHQLRSGEHRRLLRSAVRGAETQELTFSPIRNDDAVSAPYDSDTPVAGGLRLHAVGGGFGASRALGAAGPESGYRSGRQHVAGLSGDGAPGAAVDFAERYRHDRHGS